MIHGDQAWIMCNLCGRGGSDRSENLHGLHAGWQFVVANRLGTGKSKLAETVAAPTPQDPRSEQSARGPDTRYDSNGGTINLDVSGNRGVLIITDGFGIPIT
jgi:hypothetical protein